MRATDTPGVIANTLRKNGAVRDVRRMTGLESAAGLLGGQAALAAALGIDPRLLRFKISAERPISDADLRLAVTALNARASKTVELAARLAALIQEQETSA
ncbi:hypothetical protein [Sphingomonas sp. MMS24-J13]|uniref:hypothetical protein n=1 Tax=Sphingomonas sp. MMS24-J13 TaxID=3238686 RepID=UPI00385132F1